MGRTMKLSRSPKVRGWRELGAKENQQDDRVWPLAPGLRASYNNHSKKLPLRSCLVELLPRFCTVLVYIGAVKSHCFIQVWHEARGCQWRDVWHHGHLIQIFKRPAKKSGVCSKQPQEFINTKMAQPPQEPLAFDPVSWLQVATCSVWRDLEI